MHCRRSSNWLAGTLLFLLPVATGCEHQAQPVPTAPPVVTVATPRKEKLQETSQFTGRTAAVESVDVRARVSGYLDKIFFKEGALVKKGDVLFEIDPRPYKAALDQAEGSVTSLEARVRRLSTDKQRAISSGIGKGTSREEYDKINGDLAEAEAGLISAKANVRTYKLNLEFTKVTARISGRISRALVTEGNLVTTDQTLLTTIVSVDPIYAFFDVDEPTVLHYQQMIREKKAKSARAGQEVPVYLGLANEKGHPHAGVIDFVDNKIDPSTGTLRVRAVFKNPDGILTPGLFVRILLPVGEPHEALLVPERALGTDQGQKFVYVVNEKNEVEYRPVTVGQLHDRMREIIEGLKPTNRVIINGLQRVRPGVTVNPKQTTDDTDSTDKKPRRA